jgi:hypothetical protein
MTCMPVAVWCSQDLGQGLVSAACQPQLTLAWVTTLGPVRMLQDYNAGFTGALVGLVQLLQ